jgi:hypothetical protein
MSDEYHTNERKQLLGNGYSITPNRSKRCLQKGWNSEEFRAREMRAGRLDRWPVRFPRFKATGLVVRDRLAVLDLDVDDGEMIAGIMGVLREQAPDFHDRAPCRFGGGTHKVALFGLLEADDEPFALRHSDKYIDPAGEDHQIEIFGSGTNKDGGYSRQVGIYGPHSYNDKDEGDEVLREYAWADGPTLLNTPREALPVLPKAVQWAVIGKFEEMAKAAGWKKQEKPDGDVAEQVYDIDENTRFDTDKGGRGVTYAEICDEHAAFGDMRCSSNFMPDRGTSGKTDRCWVFHSQRHDCVAVFVYGDKQTHYPKSCAPAPDVIQEALRDLLTKEVPTPTKGTPTRPGDDAKMEHKILWLLLSYGYCALSDVVVELYKPGDDCQLKPQAFQRLFKAWREKIVGPRKGVKYAYATGYWEATAGRIDLEGVRLRPDKPFPLYLEDGRRFKNTYLRPTHTGHGDIKPWLAFMAHLLPDVIEREWFCNWVAHKHLNPGVPGVAVIMVATSPDGPIYGAGRGMLRDILARLLGPKYVKPIDFDVFTGKSAQGIYTDWGAYATLVTVNEAKDTPESGRWTERRAVYERLREIVDPRAIERTFIVKGKQAFSGLSFASYLVFSNNRDALQIPEGDRRVAALANGERMAPEMAAALQAWMNQPGNIAGLARWLEARDLTGFDAYAPPSTETKTTMQELARSELDDAFMTIRRRIGPNGLFTGEQIRAAVVQEAGDTGVGDELRRWVNRRIRSEAVQVKDYRTPSPVRNKILGWRGTSSAWVADLAIAQHAVENTTTNLAKNQPDGTLAEVLILALAQKSVPAKSSGTDFSQNSVPSPVPSPVPGGKDK